MQRVAACAVMDLMATTRARRANHGGFRLSDGGKETLLTNSHREVVVFFGVAKTSCHATTACVKHFESLAKETTKETRRMRGSIGVDQSQELRARVLSRAVSR